MLVRLKVFESRSRSHLRDSKAMSLGLVSLVTLLSLGLVHKYWSRHTVQYSVSECFSFFHFFLKRFVNIFRFDPEGSGSIRAKHFTMTMIFLSATKNVL